MPLKQTAITDLPFPKGDPDVQVTSFSLDVMGRFFCNTLPEALTNPDFDVVVIGAGMYGAYTASKIYRQSRARDGKPLRVLVLEAGPFLIHEHGQNIPDLGLTEAGEMVSTYSQDAGKARKLVWGVGWRSNVDFRATAYCVGGKSLFWGGWCPRLRNSDLEQWPEEVKKYLLEPPQFSSDLPNRLSSPAQNSVYEEVEFEIGVKPPDDYVFDPVAGPNDPPGSIGLNEALENRIKVALTALRAGAGTPFQNPEPPPIAVQTQSFVSGVFSPDKFSSLTLLISALRDARSQSDASAGLFLVPRAHVSRLVIPRIVKDDANPEGYAITGIDFFVDGKRQYLPIKKTTTVVLALGCIESTRLALDSFPTSTQRDGADELMGRNLMAHLRFDFQFAVDRKAFREWVEKNLGKKLRDELQTASFHLQAETPDGRFHFQVYGSGEAGGPEGLLYKMIPDAEVARRLASKQDPSKISLVFRACGEMKGNRKAKVHDSGTNWIDLASFADRDHAFDHSRAFVHYENQENAGIWNRMKDACFTLAREMGGVDLPVGIDRQQVGSTWHDAGTLFMGSDPNRSVTDVNGHFHHIANAACVDQGLFPTVGSANPVLTGLCLSRKVSETIVDRCHTEPELTVSDIAREEGEGFEFLLKGSNADKWKPNHPRLVDNLHQPLIQNGSIIETHGDAGLGVIFYDDANLFADFELRLQWKAFLTPDGDVTANSGIFLRAPLPPLILNDANYYDQAIEIQIDDTGYDFAKRRFRSAFHRTGAIYKISPARVRVQKILTTEGTFGFWNNYRIIAKGTTIRVELNGSLVSEGDVPPGLAKPGQIALQYHTGKVQFQSIRIKRI